MSHALVDAEFNGFARSRVLHGVELATFTESSETSAPRSRFPARTSSTRSQRR